MMMTAVYWKGKKWILEVKWMKVIQHLPWEKEAYDKTDDYETL